MANFNRNFSGDEFDSIKEKYLELAAIREAAGALVGREDTQSIIQGLYDRAQAERKYKCPAHFCLDLTPSKKKAVEETWTEMIQSLIALGTRPDSVDYLVCKMKELTSIKEAKEFLENRKKFALDSKEEKTFKRTIK
jgi:hypothetical protein